MKLKIEKVILGGEGLGFLGKLAVFVPYTCPGDEIEAEITEKKKNFARARITSIISPSPSRIKPPCPFHFSAERGSATTSYFYCGGCNWQMMNYTAQLSCKETLIKDALFNIGKLKDVKINKTVGMKEPWSYRNKVPSPVGLYKGRVIAGFYTPKSHNLVSIERCLLEDKNLSPVFSEIKILLNDFKVMPYNEKKHQGILRHIILRISKVNNEILVIFVTKTQLFPQIKEICGILLRKFKNISGVFQNINPHRTNVILGEKTIKIFGRDYIIEKICGMKYRISPTSFFQTNTEITEKLYKLVEELCPNNSFIIDVYSGTGTIGILLAKKSRIVYCVEENPDAVFDAKESAKLNEIKNCKFFCAKAEIFFNRFFYNTKQFKPITVVLDPPRSGCSRDVVKSLIKLKPNKIIYISCNPATLARDLEILVDNRYKVKQVFPFDMFPHTAHIESVSEITLG